MRSGISTFAMFSRIVSPALVIALGLVGSCADDGDSTSEIPAFEAQEDNYIPGASDAAVADDSGASEAVALIRGTGEIGGVAIFSDGEEVATVVESDNLGRIETVLGASFTDEHGIKLAVEPNEEGLPKKLFLSDATITFEKYYIHGVSVSADVTIETVGGDVHRIEGMKFVEVNALKRLEIEKGPARKTPLLGIPLPSAIVYSSLLLQAGACAGKEIAYSINDEIVVSKTARVCKSLSGVHEVSRLEKLHRVSLEKLLNGEICIQVLSLSGCADFSLERIKEFIHSCGIGSQPVDDDDDDQPGDDDDNPGDDDDDQPGDDDDTGVCGDFSCGKDKVEICHKFISPAAKTLCLPSEAIADHLDHGDYCGPCAE